jgi:molybdate-binding protein
VGCGKRFYNIPFVHRLLPGKEVTIVTLAHRRQGLIVAPGNPRNIRGLADLPAQASDLQTVNPGQARASG